MALDYNDIIRSDSPLIQEQTLLFFQMQKKLYYIDCLKWYTFCLLCIWTIISYIRFIVLSRGSHWLSLLFLLLLLCVCDLPQSYPVLFQALHYAICFHQSAFSWSPLLSCLRLNIFLLDSSGFRKQVSLCHH